MRQRVQPDQESPGGAQRFAQKKQKPRRQLGGEPQKPQSGEAGRTSNSDLPLSAACNCSIKELCSCRVTVSAAT